MIGFKLLILTSLIIILATPAYSIASEIYVWRNKEGILVYSDTPHPGAEEVKTPSSNIVKSSSIKTKELDINPQVIKKIYRVVISSPKDKQTIRNNKGSVYISGGVTPVFQLGHTVQLYLDQKKYQEPQKRSVFSLRDVERGDHKIKMDLLDDKGKVIASSKSITFYMHRASVN